MSDRLLSTLSLPLPTLSALADAGYETVHDLSNSTPELLSKDLNVPLPVSQDVFSATRASTAFPMTQSAAAMMGPATRYSTGCMPLDKLLSGGIKRGTVLEINGPPGCGKERIATNAVRSFVEVRHEVLFVDMQNMVPPAAIKRTLAESPSVLSDGMDLVHYLTLHTPVELVVFTRSLSAYLVAHPSTALLVLNSLAFPFQSLADYKERNAILDKLKETIAKACATRNLTIVITSQLLSKSLEAGGEHGSAPPGSRFTMVPTFAQMHFPAGRTYRVMMIPRSYERIPRRGLKTLGVMSLIHSPTHVPNASVPQVNYQRIGDVIQLQVQ